MASAVTGCPTPTTGGTPSSYATLAYYVVNAFRFHAADGTTRDGRYTWVPEAGTQLLGEDEAADGGARLPGERVGCSAG